VSHHRQEPPDHAGDLSEFLVDEGLLENRPIELLTFGLLLLAAWLSLRIAATSTVLCLLLGYPMAYAIARARPGLRPAGTGPPRA
jgi:ABC-type spermidine/putrescine transport system permease subunit I